MKKIIILLFVLVSIGSYGQKAYEAGDKILNLGLSVGYYGYGFTGSRSAGFLPVNASFEYGVTDVISIGPYIGIANWRYRLNNSRYTYRFINVGVKGTFHLTPILNNIADSDINEANIDIYLALLAGLEFRQFDGDNALLFGDQTAVRIGPLLGVKYMVATNFGVYAEIGRGTLGFLTFGVSLRF